MVLTEAGDGVFNLNPIDLNILRTIKGLTLCLSSLSVALLVWEMVVIFLLNPDLFECKGKEKLFCEKRNSTHWRCLSKEREWLLEDPVAQKLFQSKAKQHSATCGPSYASVERTYEKCDKHKTCFQESKNEILGPVYQFFFGVGVYLNIREEMAHEVVNYRELRNVISGSLWLFGAILFVDGYYNYLDIVNPLAVPIIHVLSLIGLSVSGHLMGYFIHFMNWVVFGLSYSFGNRLDFIIDD